MGTKNAGLRKGLVLGTVAGAAFGLVGAVGVGTASAATTLKYDCTYPLIGKQSMTVEISTNIPAKLGVYQETGTIQTTWKATLGADTVKGLKAVDAATIEGTAAANAEVTSPDNPGGIPVGIDNALQKTNIPASGTMVVNGYGEAPSIGFTQAGTAVAKLSEIKLRVTPRKAGGAATGMGSFDATCTLAAGQNGTVATAEIVEGDQPLPEPIPRPSWYPGSDPGLPSGTLKYGFNLTGESFVKTANGTLPLNGSIDVDVNGSTGAVSGDLKLNKTSGQMRILGLLPVVVDVDFEQVGKTTGVYAGAEIKTTSKMYIKLPKFTLFGLPLSQQETCRTVEPSVVELTSPAGQFFDPKAGGTISTKNYTISAIENCGAMTRILSPFTAGSGNTIDLTLKPKA